MSFIGAAAPLELTPRALKTASFPTQRAANDEGGDGCDRQYAISASVKLRETKVKFHDGTALMSSAEIVSTTRVQVSDVRHTLIDANTCRGSCGQDLSDGLRVGHIKRRLCRQLRREGVASSLRIIRGPRPRVQQNWALEFLGIWGIVLDLDE